MATSSRTAITSRRHGTLAILCGGLSQRFGTDKGLFSPLGDEPLVARAIRLLGEDFAEILVVLRDAEQASLYQRCLDPLLHHAPFDRVRLVHDQMGEIIPGAASAALTSALLGIDSALQGASYDRVTVVPVDQVGVRLPHLALLEAGSHDHVSPVSFRGLDGSPLPFPSLWRKAHQEQVAARIAARGLSVRGTLAQLSAVLVPSESSLTMLEINANTAAEARQYFGQPLFDPYGRRLHYLRFSLTEACNLSCRYCLPEGFPEWYRHKARLDKSAVESLTQGFRLLGFRKIRFTGGEPLVHPDAMDAVRFAQRAGYEEIAMTTNGLLMDDVTLWQEAGLTHLNVSLDSLDPRMFYAVTGSHDALKVRTTIERAVAAGIKVKVNTVLMRSRNGHEQNIRDLVEWALPLPISLRFIELMDTKLNQTFAASERVFGHEIESLLADYGLKKIAKDGRRLFLGGPATEYAAAHHPGRVGLINPLSCNFCADCNRLRVTARGGLKLCLFGDEDIPLDRVSPEAVAAQVRALIGQKPEKHYLEEGRVGNVATFRTIGG